MTESAKGKVQVSAKPAGSGPLTVLDALPTELRALIFQALDLKSLALIEADYNLHSAAQTSKQWSTAVWNAQASIVVTKRHAMTVLKMQLGKLKGLKSLTFQPHTTNAIDQASAFIEAIATPAQLDLLCRLEELHIHWYWPPKQLPLLAKMTRLKSLIVLGTEKPPRKRGRGLSSKLECPIGQRIATMTSLEKLYWGESFTPFPAVNGQFLLTKLTELTFHYLPSADKQWADVIRKTTTLQILRVTTHPKEFKSLLAPHLKLYFNNDPYLFHAINARAGYVNNLTFPELQDFAQLQPGALNLRRSDGLTPLMATADVGLIDLLVKAGADMFATVSPRQAPRRLYWVEEANDLLRVSEYLKNGAPTNSDTVLTLALRSNNFQLAKALLRRCPAPLQLAKASHPHALFVCLSNSTSFTIVPEEASEENIREFVQTLIELDPNLASLHMTKNGNVKWTLLHEAMANHAMQALPILMEACTDQVISEWINYSDDIGQNPLHFICAYNAPALVHRLVALGCDQFVESGLGTTPLDIAIQHNRTAVIQELLKANSPKLSAELASKHRGAQILVSACNRQKPNYPLINQVFIAAGDQVGRFFVEIQPCALQYAAMNLRLLKSALSLDRKYLQLSEAELLEEQERDESQKRHDTMAAQAYVEALPQESFDDISPDSQEIEKQLADLPILLRLDTTPSAKLAGAAALSWASHRATVEVLLKAGADQNYLLTLPPASGEDDESDSDAEFGEIVPELLRLKARGPGSIRKRAFPSTDEPKELGKRTSEEELQAKSKKAKGVEYPLVSATRKLNSECVEALLKAGANIDGVGHSEITALTAAISRAFDSETSYDHRATAVKLVDYFLSLGAHPSIGEFPEKTSLLRLAARVEVLEYMNKNRDWRVDAKKIAEKLSNDPRCTDFTNVHPKSNSTALSLALGLSLSPTAIAKILHQQAPIEAFKFPGPGKMNILHLIANLNEPVHKQAYTPQDEEKEYGSFAAWVASKCLKLCPEVNAHSDSGDTPLISVTRELMLPVIEIFVQQSNPTLSAKNNRGETALHVACASKGESLPVVKYLLHIGADPNTAGPLTPFFSPLQAAAERNRPDIVKELIARSARMGGVDLPRIVAAPQKNAELLLLLVENMPQWKKLLGDELQERLRDKITDAGLPLPEALKLKIPAHTAAEAFIRAREANPTAPSPFGATFLKNPPALFGAQLFGGVFTPAQTASSTTPPPGPTPAPDFHFGSPNPSAAPEKPTVNYFSGFSLPGAPAPAATPSVAASLFDDATPFSLSKPTPPSPTPSVATTSAFTFSSNPFTPEKQAAGSTPITPASPSPATPTGAEVMSPSVGSLLQALAGLSLSPSKPE